MKLFSQIEIDPRDIDGVPMVNDPQTGLDDIMGWTFILITAVAIVVIIIAGIRFITSRGDPQKVSSAKNTIIYAVVGIILAALTTSIVRLVAEVVS